MNKNKNGTKEETSKQEIIRFFRRKNIYKNLILYSTIIVSIVRRIIEILREERRILSSIVNKLVNHWRNSCSSFEEFEEARSNEILFHRGNRERVLVPVEGTHVGEEIPPLETLFINKAFRAVNHWTLLSLTGQR